MTDLEKVFAALQEVETRYLVVGGVAVVLHGHPRMTADLDLVLQLSPQNVARAVGALGKLGYRPRAPVDPEQLGDEGTRREWVEEKGLTVFSMWSSEFPTTEVDIFVDEPFDFDQAYRRRLAADLGGVVVSVASIDDLIALKRISGRAKDLMDIEALEALRDGN